MQDKHEETAKTSQPILHYTQLNSESAIFTNEGLKIFIRRLDTPKIVFINGVQQELPIGTLVGISYFSPFGALEKTGSGVGAIRKFIRAFDAFFQDMD